jgi:hypothetical protein
MKLSDVDVVVMLIGGVILAGLGLAALMGGL